MRRADHPAFAPFLTLTFATAFAIPLAAIPQCKECGAATRPTDAHGDARDDLPKTGHPKLSSGRIRGSLVTFRHGATATEFLRLRWHYPRANATDKPLPQPEAFATLHATGSPREKAPLKKPTVKKPADKRARKPLLVLRACGTCGKTGHPRLDATKDNDEVQLLCRWFQLVKLPADIAKPKHPLHLIWGGPASTCLFLSHADGSGRIDVAANASRSKLRKAMLSLIAEAYERKPKQVTATLESILSKLDNHDSSLAVLDAQKQKEMLKSAPSRRKITQIEKKLAATRRARTKVLERATKMSDLKLRPKPRRK